MDVPVRSSLVSLIDQFIQVAGGPQVRRDAARPTVILEGVGGSGRSRVLDDTWRRWAKKTPIATAETSGYHVSFPRGVLAHIAMAGPIEDADPKKSTGIMRQRINDYHDPSLVATLLRRLLPLAGGSLGLDAAGLDRTIEEMTGRI